MIQTNDVFSITDLRYKTKSVLKQTQERGIVYLLRKSKIEAALVDINYLQALQEVYEEYLDIIEYDKSISLKRIPIEKHIEKYAKKQERKSKK